MQDLLGNVSESEPEHGVLTKEQVDEQNKRNYIPLTIRQLET